MATIGQAAGVVIVTLQLVTVVYLVITLHKSSWPERGQEPSKFTGLPIWVNAPCPSLQPIVKMTLLEYASVFFAGVSALVCIRKGQNKTNKSIWGTFGAIVNAVIKVIVPDKHMPSTNWSTFDAIITAYVIITFIDLIAALVLSIGKLWAIFGLFHNIMEVFIVAALLRMTKTNYVILITLVYSVAVTGGSSQLPWYWDSMFFKFQGLTLDFMLPVLFSIVAYENHAQVPHDNLDVNPDQSGENQPLIVRNTPRLKDLGYLIFAALVHLSGNIADTVGNDSDISMFIFHLSYFVAFPTYALYVHKAKVYKNGNLKANITVFDFILLFLWGATASAIVALIGINELRCT